MFNKPFSLALRAFHIPIPRVQPPTQRQNNQQQPHLQARRQLCVSAAHVNVGPVLSVLAKTGARWGGSMVFFAGAAYALAQSNRAPESADGSDLEIEWVRRLAEGEGVEEVLSPGQQLRRHPVGKLVVEQDHLFETMVASGQIKELRCFYDTRKRVFYSVVELGREVCGFPQTVHGGLTAALVDETAGGLAVELWRAGDLGFRPPAYTARLEVDYKRKIPNGSILLIATEVDALADRKVWLKATVSNGKGSVYATGRALFVAPRWLPDWLQSLRGVGSGRSSAPRAA